MGESCSFNLPYVLCILFSVTLVISSNFSFEGGTSVLIASVPGHCSSFTFSIEGFEGGIWVAPVPGHWIHVTSTENFRRESDSQCSQKSCYSDTLKTSLKELSPGKRLHGNEQSSVASSEKAQYEAKIIREAERKRLDAKPEPPRDRHQSHHFQS